MDYQDLRNFIQLMVEEVKKDADGLIFCFKMKSRNNKKCYSETLDFEVLISMDSKPKGVWWKRRDQETWINTCYNDSCWKSEGLKFIFEIWINKRDNMANRFQNVLNIHEINSMVRFEFGLFNAVREAKVEYALDKENPGRYKVISYETS